MAIPRKKQVILTETKFYHCMSRCVRRAFLCGVDHYTKTNYEHRREWVERRLIKLAKIFTIDVCSYAVMHNHTHLVLHVDNNRIQTLSDREILRRWGEIHELSNAAKAFIAHKSNILSEHEVASVKKLVAKRRQSLCCISTFMKELNQYIATKANREDNCKGKFWESRFKSQALLDFRSLIACMVYVDLNPMRVGAANALTTSEYTSIRKRIIEARIGKQPFELLPFKVDQFNQENHIPIELHSYLALVNQTALSISHPSTKVIPLSLRKLNITPEIWRELCAHFEELFGYVVGSPKKLESYKNELKQKRIKGVANARRFLE
jgi:hypothetical protein